MKKTLLFFIAAFLLGSCTSKIYNSSGWQGIPVTVDGNLPEWSNPLRFYDQQTGINYSISNDRKNLYFCCSISSEALQIKILRSGIEFGIDTLGKKSYPVTFRYPFGNLIETETKRNQDSENPAGTNVKPDRSQLRMRLLAAANEVQLTGFKPRLGKVINLSSSNTSGIAAAINFDKSGMMDYEVAIPFSTFYKQELTPSDSNKIFNYQIKVSPISRSNEGGNSGNAGGGSRSGMGGGGMRGGGGGGGGMRGGGMGGGGMRGGGMRGGGMGGDRSSEGGNSQRNTMSTLTKTTIQLKLSYR